MIKQNKVKSPGQLLVQIENTWKKSREQNTLLKGFQMHIRKKYSHVGCVAIKG
jgi:hypothetical protein